MQRRPRALVLRWCRRQVCVRCPYCLEEHRHGPGFHPRTEQFRLSHCIDIDKANYQFLYPYEDHPEAYEYGWEFDQADRSFYTVNRAGQVGQTESPWPDRRTLVSSVDHDFDYEAPDEEADTIETLAEDAARMNLGVREEPLIRSTSQTGEEMLAEFYRDPKWRRSVYFGHCIMREVNALSCLFAKYEDDDFPSVVDEGDGNNGITAVASEEDAVPTIQWLQCKGVDLHHANIYGRTALMEAALWGRYETVKYLIKQGVDHNPRDGNGMRAIDLASTMSRNQKERSSRSPAYREPSDAPQQRERIVNYLSRLDPSIPPAMTPPAPEGNLGFFQRTRDGSLMLFKQVTLLEVPGGQSQKAFASMDRGHEYPIVNSMSGYAAFTGWNSVLDNGLWTEKSLDLCEQIGHLTERSYASHAEKQLAAYFVDRHCPLRSYESATGPKELEDFKGVMEVMPPRLPGDVVIAVSKRTVCSDCVAFFETLNSHLAQEYQVTLTVKPVSDSIRT